MEDRILHHSDRPEIELRILSFLTHALGPSTEGVAREMGISSDAAAVHLQALVEADRVWSQSGPGARTPGTYPKRAGTSWPSERPRE